jgi:hypothetical protein
LSPSQLKPSELRWFSNYYPVDPGNMGYIILSCSQALILHKQTLFSFTEKVVTPFFCLFWCHFPVLEAWLWILPQKFPREAKWTLQWVCSPAFSLFSSRSQSEDLGKVRKQESRPGGAELGLCHTVQIHLPGRTVAHLLGLVMEKSARTSSPNVGVTLGNRPGPAICWNNFLMFIFLKWSLKIVQPWNKMKRFHFSLVCGYWFWEISKWKKENKNRITLLNLRNQ